MNDPVGFLPGRTLTGLIALGIFNHVLLAGGRVAVSLQALALGESPAIVGLLMALFALLPALFAIPIGRLADRMGARRPMLVGCGGCCTAGLIPALWPGLSALFVASTLAGVAFVLFQIPAQRAIGDLGAPEERTASFSWYALGFSVSGIVGPLIAGFAIDQLGYRWAFVLLAVWPAVAFAVLAGRRVALPVVRAGDGEHRATGMFDLLRQPSLRRLLLLNALFAMGWDLHTIFVPIYGTGIGLSAAEIGVILSAFAAATFVVRLAVPWFGRDLQGLRVLSIALFTAAAVYLAFPFTGSAAALIVLSFLLGLGLGIGQPVVMAMLHATAPPGRIGEAVGLRMSMIQAMAVTVPLAFGALGATFGLGPVLGAVGVFLGIGGIAAGRMRG